MCNKQNLPNRVEKAKAAKRFSRAMSHDRDGRPKTFVVPGTEGKRYHVIVRRKPRLTVELNLDTARGLIKPYYARQHITYHSMAALMMAAEREGYKIAWCANKKDAERRARLRGRVFSVQNFDNRDNIEYGVLYD